MERRAFFKLAGASAAALAIGGSLAGCDPKSLLPATPHTEGIERPAGFVPISFSEEVDVLIVGSGIAGLSAAMEPIEAKKSVLVVEKNELLGGESFTSNGLFYVSGTELQQKAGFSTTATEAWRARKTELEAEGDTNNLSFKENVMMAQTEWVNRVVSDYKAVFADPKSYVTDGTPSSILMPKNGIADMDSIMTPLKDTLAASGVSFTLSMRAEAFILNGEDAVVGMRFRSEKSDAIHDVKAQKIVIATGSFASNQQLVSANIPAQTTIGCLTTTSTGDGISLCQRINGQTADMDKKAPLISDLAQASTWGLFGPTINVTSFGTRFAREDQPGQTAGECFSRDLGFWWTIFGKQLSDGIVSRSVAQISSKNTKRVVGPFNTVDELALAMNIPAKTIQTTFDDYAIAVEAKKDSAFGRTAHLQTIEAPYWAIKQLPVRYTTFGGMKTDDSGRLNTGVAAFMENVYCCGSCAAGSVNGLASAAGFGMLVGKAIASELG